jgi:hypothetical protein
LGVAQRILTLIVLLSGYAQTAERANPAETADKDVVVVATTADHDAITEQAARRYAAQEGAAQQRLELLQGSEFENAAAIASCESGHRLDDGTADLHTHEWQAQNGVSSASGAFQFVDGTWNWVWQDLIGEDPPTARARDAEPHEQLRAFFTLWKDGEGAHHWDASRSCWQPMLQRSDALSS